MIKKTKISHRTILNFACLVSLLLSATTGHGQTADKNKQKNETVSFSLDVAPILITNCGRCHIANNPRGNFSIASFNALLRGGDSGPPVVTGKSKQSELVARLLGEDAAVMPPSGKLNDDLINTITTWIDQGANFDGDDAEMALNAVATKAKKDASTHQELIEQRANSAQKTWTLVMNSVESQTVGSKNFTVIGSSGKRRLSEVSKSCEKLATKIASALKADKDKPLVKGNTTVFVFDKRYDMSEFGKMTQQRDFPKHLRGHWSVNATDTHAAVLMTRNQNAKDIQATLAHQIAAIHIASLSADVPRWFADGVGLWAAKKTCPKSELAKTLETKSQSIAATMARPDDFLTNKMPPDQAAYVSYRFVKNLRKKSSRFGKLMKALSAGDSFESSFRKIYGSTPAEFLNR